jgi:hypothetical protein
MRGGAQAHLIEAADGNFYVVKFRNNPQHRRILVNEAMSAVLLGHLQIAAPGFEFIDFSPEFIRQNPAARITLGTNEIQPDPGWHFGSRYPGDPALMAVYDFVPDSLLDRVDNLDHFRGILVFDKWVSNGDARQCVFYRKRAGGVVTWVASMIDHGFAFQGPNWEFVDAPLQGTYPRRRVYESVRSLRDFEPWLEWVRHFPREVIDDAWKRVPFDWIDGEEDALERLLEKLHQRRERTPELIRDILRARSTPFSNWEGE